MKRIEHGASSASSIKGSSASGSRSIATSVPSGPKRSQSRAACPPPPKVQSTTVWPGERARSSSSSSASTGMWTAGMSSRMVNARGYLSDAAKQRRSMFVPAEAIPQLQAVARPDDDDLLAQLGVLAEKARHHDPPGRVQLRVV